MICCIVFYKPKIFLHLNVFEFW